MTKHTLGPWEALRTKPVAGCNVAPGWAISPVKGRKPLLDIGQVHLSASQKEATQEANARLIAAAPELLEACKEALRSLPGRDKQTDQQKVAFHLLRSAIAKATASL